MSLRRSSTLWAYCAQGPASTSASTVSTRTTCPAAARTFLSLQNLNPTPLRLFSTTSPWSARVQGHHAKDHYKILKLHQTASKQQIKARFYEMSKQLHPDTPGGNSEKFHEISEAYGILGDDSKRREYDLSLAPPPSYFSTAHTPNFGTSASYPYSDPLSHRRTGPHAGWSTRRPPPKQTPPPGGLHYSAFGRHTPHNYKDRGGSSGSSYGEPFMASREQLREEFANVRRGTRSHSSELHGGTASGGGWESTSGGGAGQRKDDDGVHGGGGQIVMVFVLVLVVCFMTRGVTARADDGEEEAGERVEHRGHLSEHAGYISEELGDGWGANR